MKRGGFVVCCVVALVALLTACGTTIQEEWATILLGERLPTPQEGSLRSGSNLDDLFMGGIENIKSDYYAEYKRLCIEMGYSVESKESSNSYDAYNTEGYELSLSYYGDEIHITLKAPLDLKEYEWPATGLAARLPIPKSNLAKVTSDSSKSYVVIVGNTTLDDYNNYVKQCEEKGFVEDYTKAEGNYAAQDAEGYRINLRYVGFAQIEIMIQVPKEDNNVMDSDKEEATDSTSDSDEAIVGIGDEFKEAMDSYESFMDEYIAFMKKYRANPTDMSLLTNYATYVSQYAEFVEDFEKWKDEEMNPAETAYYIEVQTRVSKKLLEVMQ